MTQALTKALPSLSKATPHGLLVPSQKSWNSCVLGWMRNRAQVKSKVLSPCLTTLRLKTPLRPYSQPSGPHRSELGSSCVSNRPKPVTTTCGLPSLGVAKSSNGKKRMSGALASQTPPWPIAMPEGMLRPSITVVILSNLPSPLVLSNTLTRSMPAPGDFLGYSSDSVIQIRPRSSNVIATGLTMSGSAATSSTWNPGGTSIFLSASCCDSGGPGGADWPWGMTSWGLSLDWAGSGVVAAASPAKVSNSKAWIFIVEFSDL